MNYKALIEAIASKLKSTISAERFQRLKAFELKVGASHQLDSHLIQQHFTTYKIENLDFKSIDIEITIVPKTIQCEWCALTSTIENYQNVCKYCGKQTEIELTGSELAIGRLVF